MGLASNHISREILERLKIVEKFSTAKFLNNSKGMPLLAHARGHLYEEMAHDKLSAGGTFRYYEYNNPTIREINIPMKQFQKFYFEDDIDPENYAVPHSSNYNYIDSASTGSGSIYQMTIQEKRSLGIKIKELLTKYDMDHANLYYVVPQDIFTKFTVSSWQSTWKNDEAITIYILEVDP